MALCALSHICGLSAGQMRHDDPHCILHSELSPKDVPAFDGAIKTLIERRNYNFRSVRFPQSASGLAAQTFTSDVDLTDVVIPHILDLTRSTFHGALCVRSSGASQIALSEARIAGPVNIEIQTGLGTLDFISTNVDGPVNIRAGQHISHFRAMSATFREDLVVVTPEVKHLETQDAQFVKSLRLQVQRIHIGPLPRDIGGDFVLRLCYILGEMGLSQVAFGPESTLDLSGATLVGRLTVDGASTPRSVLLNRATLHGDVHIRSPYGAPLIQIIATQIAPSFRREIVLTNVDLRECLLVGSPMEAFKLSGVKWPEARLRRRTLYDERAYRAGTVEIKEGDLREACQVLKEKYRTQGDHVLSGEFHYTEMEMKRREYGWPRRAVCPEFVYWALSGYGIGYVRAFAWLLVLLVASALVYWYFRPAFVHRFDDALWFSVRALTLQKPEANEVTQLMGFARWWYLVEIILSPLLIALFVLAVRMRLRR